MEEQTCLMVKVWLQGLPALDLQQNVALTIVVSSIQMVNNQSYNSENWGQYPAERARMLALLRAWPCAVVVISGDRHFSEMAQECRQLPPPHPHLPPQSVRRFCDFVSLQRGKCRV